MYEDRVYVIVKKGLYMRRSMRRGKGKHTWTNNIRKARTYESLDKARENVIEVGLNYPYDEYNGKTLEGAWIRPVLMTPENKRYEVFGTDYSSTSCGPEDVEADESKT